MRYEEKYEERIIRSIRGEKTKYENTEKSEEST